MNRRRSRVSFAEINVCLEFLFVFVPLPKEECRTYHRWDKPTVAQNSESHLPAPNLQWIDSSDISDSKQFCNETTPLHINVPPWKVRFAEKAILYLYLFLFIRCLYTYERRWCLVVRRSKVERSVLVFLLRFLISGRTMQTRSASRASSRTNPRRTKDFEFCFDVSSFAEDIFWDFPRNEKVVKCEKRIFLNWQDLFASYPLWTRPSQSLSRRRRPTITCLQKSSLHLLLLLLIIILTLRLNNIFIIFFHLSLSPSDFSRKIRFLDFWISQYLIESLECMMFVRFHFAFASRVWYQFQHRRARLGKSSCFFCVVGMSLFYWICAYNWLVVMSEETCCVWKMTFWPINTWFYFFFRLFPPSFTTFFRFLNNFTREIRDTNG